MGRFYAEPAKPMQNLLGFFVNCLPVEDNYIHKYTNRHRQNMISREKACLEIGSSICDMYVYIVHSYKQRR